MKAFVSKIINGKPSIGTEHQWVTRKYRSVKTLVGHGVQPFLKAGESAVVEVHFNWDSRYSKPDQRLMVTHDTMVNT